MFLRQACNSRTTSSAARPAHRGCFTHRINHPVRLRSAAPSTTTVPVQGGIESCVKGDLLEITAADGGVQFAEVLRSYDAASSTAYIATNGTLQLLTSSSGEISVTDQGAFPPLEDRLFHSYPGWQAAYQEWHKRMQGSGGAEAPPSPPGSSIASVAVVHSLARLQQEVQADASLWCNGTGPEDPPLTPLQSALLSAGELLALEAGHRGICMLQLHVGWGAATRQPALRPFVPTLLHRISANKDISVVMSPAPGGLGLTAMLAAKQEPWRSWAVHLGGFGAQGSVVAQSPYYKLLIGRMLGYREDHILHHIRTAEGSEHPSEAVRDAVEAELLRLSAQAPTLPWTAAADRKKQKPSRGKRQ